MPISPLAQDSQLDMVSAIISHHTAKTAATGASAKSRVSNNKLHDAYLDASIGTSSGVSKSRREMLLQLQRQLEIEKAAGVQLQQKLQTLRKESG